MNRIFREGDWQYQAVLSLKKALDVLRIDAEQVPTRTDMKRWFRLFATLRNGTRGHGATRPSQSSEASRHLHESILAIYENLHLFQRPWVYLYRNLSGKYRVTSLGNEAPQFEFLKRETTHSYQNGVYVFFDSPRLVSLLHSDQELSDFFLPNGKFNEREFELLSFSTDNKQSASSAPYLDQPDVQTSETHGRGELVPRGACLSNAPAPARDYVVRPTLEIELFDLLMDDRHPVVTLQGAGGVGKTSSTLQVIEKLHAESRFEMVVWFSARDIDLLPSGPRTVRPGVLSPSDIAEQYATLVLSEEDRTKKGFDGRTYFQSQLGVSDGGPSLFVFDNFETVQNPTEMFAWIERFVRLPNKVLITTRLRDFRGDYPLEVHGMTDEESRTLIDRTASSLRIKDSLTENQIGQVISQSSGHPYVIKILLGEVASTGRFSLPRQVVAGRDEILTALFGRTFNALSPCGQRAFLTLAAWNSAVPRVALEAVLIRSTEEMSEVEKGIESLLHYSLAEVYDNEIDGQEYINLPLVSREFGKKLLQTNPRKAAIQVDVQILQMFSPSSALNSNLNLGRLIERFIRNVSERIARGEDYSDYEEILGMVCRAYSPGWLVLGRWHLERGNETDIKKAIENVESFLQTDPKGIEASNAWRMLGEAYYRKGDVVGQLNAYVERAQFTSTAFYDVSNTANLLNREYSSLALDPDAKRLLSEKLLEVMNNRIMEAAPDDLSRMAWLALHLGQDEKARELVQQGLEHDPENEHCSRIAERLGISRRMM